jgi:nitroreductase
MIVEIYIKDLAIMCCMDTLTCIRTRRSVRDYLDKPVPKDIIDALLDAAIMAPSAMNRQSWQFVIIEGRDKVTEYGTRAVKQWNLLNAAIRMGLTLKGTESIFYNAPLVILVCGDKANSFIKDDCNLAAENIMLAAHSMGLGSCWIGFAKPLNNDAEIRGELGIPNESEIVVPLIIGYPKKSDVRVPKRTAKILKWIK